MKDRAAVYAAVVALVAALVLAVSFKGLTSVISTDPGGAAIWFSLLVAAGILTYVTLRGGGAVTGTAVVNFAVILIYGGEAAAWFGAVEMLLLTKVLLRFGAVRSLFNVSQMAVSLALAGLVYRLAGGTSLAFEGGRFLGLGTIPALAACHLTYFFANTSLVAVWSSLRSRRSPLAVWKASYLWMLPQSFAAPLVGVALAFLYVRAALGLVAILFFWMVYYARSSKTNLELQNSQHETVRALASIVDSSTPFLGGESERVSTLAGELARRLGITGRGLQSLEFAALLHDIGYLAVGNRILSKGESLSPEEWARVRRHAELGASIVERMRGLKDASAIVRAHHERPDGRGYPLGLKAGEIPLASAILKAADAFVAMTTERPYRRAMTSDEAIQHIQARAGSQFDGQVVEALAVLHPSVELEGPEPQEVAKAA
jgi:HD-GYP domain-containing protein (c-di-GMP phosphodiesterase class II)